MRCKACNVLITPTYREVELENGEWIKIPEDLCSKCAELSYGDDDTPDTFLPHNQWDNVGNGSYIKKKLPVEK